MQEVVGSSTGGVALPGVGKTAKLFFRRASAGFAPCSLPAFAAAGSSAHCFIRLLYASGLLSVLQALRQED